MPLIRPHTKEFGKKMSKRFAILGAGMQGTAAAYDLARFADAERIVVADVSAEQSKKSADRVNKLLGKTVVESAEVNALDADALGAFLNGFDVLLSCVPYWMHPRIAKVAIATNTHMMDLGGNTEITQETLGMDEDAKAAGVTLIPDTGLAPGLVNSLAMYLLEEFDSTETIKLYCGVLPQNPKPPFNYKITFNVEGLVAEYDFEAVVLRNNEIHMIPTLTELETIHIEQLGTMEAFVTSGGTSTAPYTLQGKLKNYEYKTIRFPGHCEKMLLYKDFGLWREDEVEIKGAKVRPKDVFVKVFGDALAKFEDLDLCAIRALGIGDKGGKRTQLQIDIFDKQCEETGFTSMERLTGFSIAIHAIAAANGKFAPGALRYENAMNGHEFVDEIQRRGIHVKFSMESA